LKSGYCHAPHHHRPLDYQLALRRAKYHWHYDRKTRTLELVEGRRPAGYVVATPCAQSIGDRGIESLKVVKVDP